MKTNYQADVHKALSAITMALHSVHQTMASTPHFPLHHLSQDAGFIHDAIKKVGALKRHTHRIGKPTGANVLNGVRQDL